MEEGNKNKFFVGHLIKAAIFLLVSISVVTGNFFLEQQFASSDSAVVQEFSEFNYEEVNVLRHHGLVRFDSAHGLSNSVKPLVDDGSGYVFEVDSAKFWANFMISDVKVNFLVDDVVLIPNNAVFDLEFDGEKLTLSVFDGDVYLGFLNDDIEVTEYEDQYSPLFMNRMLVPRDTQVIIDVDQITSKIEALLYTKLVKEFKFSGIPSSKFEEQWVLTNSQEDAKYLETAKQKVVADILDIGTKIDESGLGQFVFWAEENLIFVEEKKRLVVFDHLFNYLDDAIFYATEGDSVKMNESLLGFDEYLLTLPVTFTESEEFYDHFDAYIDVLSVFNVDDPQYEIFLKLIDKKFHQNRGQHEVVERLWLDIYDGLNTSTVAAEEAVNNYFKYFGPTLGKISDVDFYNHYITYNNQLFDNLLLRHPIFYKDGYFAMKSAFENELLKLYEEGQLKEELKQAFISQKIDFLKRLMKFFFDEENIDINEAKEILERLWEEVNDLMPPESSALAVTEVFESQLEDIDDFWGYLEDSRYNSTKTYGLTHEDRYKKYLEDRDRIWSYIDIQADIVGDTSGLEQTVEEVQAEVEEFFKSHEDVSQIQLTDLSDAGQRFINVTGVIGGYPFKAQFDRDQLSLKDVYVYEKLVSDRSVKLDNLLDIIKEQLVDFVEENANGEEYTVESFAERAARVYIAQKISEYGFEIDLEDVAVLDELNAVYRIEEINLENETTTFVTFDFLMNGEIATNVFLSIKGSPVVLQGKYSLDELKDLVIAEGEFQSTEESTDLDEDSEVISR